MTTAALPRQFTTETVSDGLLVPILSAMVTAGELDGRAGFEDAMVRAIEGCADEPADGWHAFYVNSLAELDSGVAPFTPIHRRALSLLRGHRVLEVGSCFGLFALHCARTGLDVHACDVCPGAVERLDEAARRLTLPVSSRVADACALPYPDGSMDTVTLIHLLEHLEPAAAATAVDEAVRVAARRVVIAVPFEEAPSEHFGHVQALTEDDLIGWALPWIRRGVRASVFVDHGGWLVLDRVGG